MLQHLSIRNVVLISACDIPFEDGLCVLTGETGAGKSILLDALGLAIGMRADSGLLRHGEDQASVTAEFDIRGATETLEVMSDLGLEPDDSLIIRRMLHADGKNRCFANDQPISVAGLKRLGETLVEVHGQHDQRGLLDTRTHLLMIDAYGRLSAEREQVSEAYEIWHAKRMERDAMLARIEDGLREQDYLQHLCDELSALAPQPDEEETLSHLRSTMMQGEKISETIQNALNELQGNADIEAALRTAQRLLMRSAAPMAERFAPAIDALERAQVEVQESLAVLERLQRESEYDPQKLEQIEERLFALKAAGRKYHLPVHELPHLLAEAKAKLDAIDHQHHRIAALDAAVNEARTAYLNAAQKLSDERAGAAGRLQRALMKELAPLKMEACRFRVVQEELTEPHWSAIGTDSMRFEAATNAGQAYAPLHKIASGGELSRFMLALKVALASIKSTRTLIFDEIDTGTGGAVADAIGARLAMLSDHAQVLVVTHLPQVAARGTLHLNIGKTTRKGQTFTQVHVLDVDGRKEELARMLAGAEVTDEARSAANRLMQAAG